MLHLFLRLRLAVFLEVPSDSQLRTRKIVNIIVRRFFGDVSADLRCAVCPRHYAPRILRNMMMAHSLTVAVTSVPQKVLQRLDSLFNNRLT